MATSILDIDTVRLSDDGDAIELIDQTKLPGVIEVIRLDDQHDIWHAIADMQVRGAPAIGVTAAFAYYLAAKGIASNVDLKELGGTYVDTEDQADEFFFRLNKAKEYLNSARPTAVNLSWALNRMEKCTNDFSFNEDYETSLDQIHATVERLKQEALNIYNEDISTCRKIGEYALSLLNKGDGLLTHCNAGKLATIRYGTATAPMYLGHEQGYDFKIFCDETRPQLQGARLTAFELASAGMDVTLLCDNMSASLMKTGKINAVFVGCDRVAANGDTANKIGTSLLALAAKRYNVPFYVCAPTSTVDMSCSSGNDIVIEQRAASEVTDMWYERRMAPAGINVYNPAFDVTDADLITAIITEKGIIKAPFGDGFKKIF